MQNILSKIIETKKTDLCEIIKKTPKKEVVLAAETIKTGIRSFKNAISNKNLDKMNIIAELKKASPSKGVFKKDLDIVDYARKYEIAGVAAISVLTEQRYFLGDPEFLKLVRENTNIPILRKDFIIDEYQIFEAKVLGADAVLLIAEILDVSQLRDFLDIAKSLKLDCLVEAHTYAEVEKLLLAGAEIVGINNRNLEDFSVSLKTTEELKRIVPTDKIVVSESGIDTAKDIIFLKKIGVNAVLIGEAIILSDDPIKKIRSLG